MILWSVHPKHIDHARLNILWRSALLAREIIEGRVREYRGNISLYRFMAHPEKVKAINTYIYYIWLEARERGYRYAVDEVLKKDLIDTEIKIPITSGQLALEIWRLLSRIARSNPKWISKLTLAPCFEANPVFKVVEGPPDPRERIPREALNRLYRSFPFKGREIPINICA
ncbi:MAG: pyrimidine dimer DNA glycosylase/endonuclease V [Sulfolobales archaeon]